jgi:hypothetical protein
MAGELSGAQERMLKRIPDDWGPIINYYGFNSILGNQTFRALRDKGYAEMLLQPPRWRRSTKGKERADLKR